MKAFLVICLAAAVTADADPQLLAYRTASPFYSSLLPATSMVYKKPEELKKVEYKAIVPTTYGYNPLVANTYGYNSLVANPVLHAPVTYTTAQVAIAPRYYAKSAENVEHIVAKREADAEADPYFFYNAGLPYAHAAISPYGYANPLTYGVAGYPLAGNPYGLKTYANDAVSSKGYAGKGTYVAENAGAIHVAKRSADADADPLLLYGGLYNTPTYTPFASTYRTYVPHSAYNYGYSNLAYSGLYNYQG